MRVRDMTGWRAQAACMLLRIDAIHSGMTSKHKKDEQRGKAQVAAGGGGGHEEHDEGFGDARDG